MPRRYNLRPRRESLHWIQDDTLVDEETESEDSTYVSPSEEEESEDVSLVDEDDEDEDEDDEEEDQPSAIHIPMPPKGTRVTIEIDNRGGDDMDYYGDDDEDDEEEERGGFLDYLVNKYVPASRVGSRRKKDDKAPDSPALDLGEDEREYFEDLSRPKQKKLNKQMKQIAGLISNGDVPYKFRILDLPVSDAIKASVIKKIDLLNKMDMDNGESHKLRTWVDGFLNIPFGKVVPLPVKLDDGVKPCADFLAETRQTLDKAVYGMHGAKTQIMQILAQWISNPSSVGNVIALKGPMGVGKTSFARNGVANVLKRPFEFFSLGGAADASNFVGHSYTYEGAQWGRIADSLMSARCMNPVMYFDELDKVSTTAHGEEIVSMLIHLTDRSQNSQFHDRYFAGVDFDLSQCLFVFSFNDESKVHPILRDRMQVIHCAGYSSDEKKVILNQYVWPQILERINLTDKLTIGDDAVKFLIEHYSKEEEGVRTLIRAVETLVTRINLLRIADEETAKSYPFYMKIEIPMQIKCADVEHLLLDMVKHVNESWRHLYV
jgi:ATP-dependent Lon protease